jgi:hypothetical protein
MQYLLQLDEPQCFLGGDVFLQVIIKWQQKMIIKPTPIVIGSNDQLKPLEANLPRWNPAQTVIVPLIAGCLIIVTSQLFKNIKNPT